MLTIEEQSYLEKNKDLTVGVYLYFPPYEFVNDNGQVDGILIDYLKLIEDEIGYTFKKKIYSDWGAILSAVKKQEIDVILEIQETEKRSEFLNFTKPIFEGKHVVIAEKESDITSMSDLNGKRVSVGKGYSVDEFLQKNYPEIIIVPQANEIECLQSITSGKSDVTIGLETINTLLLSQQGLNALEVKFALDYKYDLSMGISKNNPILTSIINKSNNTITPRQKKSIIDKWLYNITKPFYETLLFWERLLSVLGIVAILFFGWSAYLKKEVKRRTKSLNEAKLLAEKNNEVKTLFIQNISHEVRTPLNSIIGFTNLIQDAKTDQEKQNYTKTLKTESSNLSTILENIIEISELNTTKTILQNQAFNLPEFFNNIKALYSKKAELKGLDFSFCSLLNNKEQIIFTDRIKLNSIVKNILDNAIKFTAKGIITLSVKTDSDKLVLTISDTGIGVTDDELHQIFSEFYQVEKELTKQYHGLGIGLSIAKKHVKSLKGQLVAYNKNGLEVKITIPAKFKAA